MDNLLVDLKKALDTSATNGNNVLDPVLLSNVISNQARIQPIIRNIIPRKAWQGKSYTWDVQTTPGDAETQPDGGTLSLIDGTYTQSTVNASYFYHTSFITNPALVAAQELIDLVSMRVGEASKAVLRKENSAIFNGDPNNGTFPGLAVSLNGNANFSTFVGATATRYMYGQADIALRAQGYTPSVWVVSPNLYGGIMQAAFNNVRFVGIADPANFGYPLANNALAINGVPVVMDAYAAGITTATSQTMVAAGTGGSTTDIWSFAVNGAAVTNIKAAAGGDLAGKTFVAPVIKVGGSTVTNYTLQAQSNGQMTANFTASPSSPPVATFSYATENAYLLSLSPADLVIFESLPLQVELDLAKTVQSDSIPVRVKQYSAVAVRNPNAHILCSNVTVAAASAF